MRMQAKEITELYSSKMEEILEFRAFTQFSYLQFNDAVDKGFKVTTVIGPTRKMCDQNEIKQKLESYKNGFLPKLSFQHAVSVFESWFFDIVRYLLRDKNKLNKKEKSRSRRPFVKQHN